LEIEGCTLAPFSFFFSFLQISLALDHRLYVQATISEDSRVDNQQIVVRLTPDRLLKDGCHRFSFQDLVQQVRSTFELRSQDECKLSYDDGNITICINNQQAFQIFIADLEDPSMKFGKKIKASIIKRPRVLGPVKQLTLHSFASVKQLTLVWQPREKAFLSLAWRSR
jgi:hypothetical protein